MQEGNPSHMIGKATVQEVLSHLSEIKSRAYALDSKYLR
jgi:hypothetical protein